MEPPLTSERSMRDIQAIMYCTRRLQSEIDRLGMRRHLYPGTARPQEKPGALGIYDAVVDSQELRSVTRKLFKDGHYARAVEEAYKCINNRVKAKAGLSADGHELMNKAFSVKSPVLKLNPLVTDSHINEQVGYMLSLGGCMIGIRNPRAHEHQLCDSPSIALEMLAWANHLIRRVEKAKRVRQRSKPRTP